MKARNENRLSVPTTGIDDVSGHILWCDLGRDGDLRNDVLNLGWVSGREEVQRRGGRACATKVSLIRDVMMVLFPTPSIWIVSGRSRRRGRAHRRRRGEYEHRVS